MTGKQILWGHQFRYLHQVVSGRLHLGAAPFFNMSLCLSLQFVHAAILRTIRLTTRPCLPQPLLLPINW